MSESLLIRRAGQLLTLRGPDGARRGAALSDIGIVPDGAVLITDGLIEAAGAAEDIERLAASADNVVELDAGGRVVMPGFVDSHTHLVFSQPRLLDYEMRIRGADYHQIAEAGGGITECPSGAQGGSGRIGSSSTPRDSQFRPARNHDRRGEIGIRS